MAVGVEVGLWGWGWISVTPPHPYEEETAEEVVVMEAPNMIYGTSPHAIAKTVAGPAVVVQVGGRRRLYASPILPPNPPTILETVIAEVARIGTVEVAKYGIVEVVRFGTVDVAKIRIVEVARKDVKIGGTLDPDPLFHNLRPQPECRQGVHILEG